MFIVAVLLVGNRSRLAADALIIAGFGSAAYVFLRDRTGMGQYAVSTDCEECGALLQEHYGVPERKCRNCGHSQSWAK